MKVSDGNGNISFNDALEAFPSFKEAVADIRQLRQQLRNDPGMFLKTFPFMRKQANEFMEYQRAITMVRRDPFKDRVFPLDTVEIQRFRTANNADIENATIHTGPAADEFVRSLNALAVTVAGDIYFRNGAYRPETEEGRMLLAHELTHIRQHDENRINKQTSEQELEDEAIAAEGTEAYESDPVVTVEMEGELFRFRKSMMSRVSREVARDIDLWLEDQRNSLEEQKYLQLLCAYRSWIGEAL